MTALKIARKAAKNSLHPQHQMAAVVTRGGAVISVGVNGPPGRGHAEARALRLKRDYQGCDMAIVRLRGRKISRPCLKCAWRIQFAGIRRVTFTDNDCCEKTMLAEDLTIFLDTTKSIG